MMQNTSHFILEVISHHLSERYFQSPPSTLNISRKRELPAEGWGDLTIQVLHLLLDLLIQNSRLKQREVTTIRKGQFLAACGFIKTKFLLVCLFKKILFHLLKKPFSILIKTSF